MQKIRKAMRVLRDWDPEADSLAKKKLVTDGSDIYVTTSDRTVLRSVLKGGQLAFTVILLGDLVRHVEQEIRIYGDKKMAL